MGYHFVPQCNQAQESHACQCFHFFCQICRTTVCWEPKILLLSQRDVLASFFYYENLALVVFLVLESKALFTAPPYLVQCKVTAVVCQCYPFFTKMKRSQVSLLLRKDRHRVAKTVQTVTKNYLFLGFISTKAYQKSTSSSKESTSHESPMYAVDCEMVGRLLKQCNVYSV